MARLLSFQNKTSPEINDFLSENILGTPQQSMVYQQMRTADKLQHIPTPTFMSLKKGTSIIGTSCFCKRTFSDFTAFYIRYFSFKEMYRRTTKQNLKQRKKSIIKQEVLHALEKGGEFTPNTHPTLFYAYVDPNNQRSNQLCTEFGFEKIRTFSTLTFSRFFPKKDPRVTRLPSEKKEGMRLLLNTFYQDYNLYTEENLFYEGHYFVLRNESDEILAGVQASQEHWDIKEMPGIMGWATLHILSKIPFLRSLINPNHRFIAFESLYFKPEHENDLQILLESVLSQFHLNSGLLTIDSNAKLYQSVLKLSLGPLMRLKKEVSVNIIVKSSNVSAHILSKLKRQPCFISTFDLT